MGNGETRRIEKRTHIADRIADLGVGIGDLVKLRYGERRNLDEVGYVEEIYSPRYIRLSSGPTRIHVSGHIWEKEGWLVRTIERFIGTRIKVEYKKEFENFSDIEVLSRARGEKGGRE